jgi:hypothetical protein
VLLGSRVVKLIMDGRIRTARGQASGYLGILVDPRDVTKAVRGPKNDGLPLRKVAALLGTHDGVVASLIAAGHLASYRGVNAVNRCPQTLVAPQEIKRFKATYVSLYELAKERKVYIGTMKSELDADGRVRSEGGRCEVLPPANDRWIAPQQALTLCGRGESMVRVRRQSAAGQHCLHLFRSGRAIARSICPERRPRPAPPNRLVGVSCRQSDLLPAPPRAAAVGQHPGFRAQGNSRVHAKRNQR